MRTLSISLFGAFQVTIDGEPAVFEADSARALLAYLAVNAGLDHSRQKLAALLWPEHLERQAFQDLRKALGRLRLALHERAAEPSPLDVTRWALRFNCGNGCWVDTGEFGALLAACRVHRHRRRADCPVCMEKLRVAAELYRGEFLSDVGVHSERFQEWVMAVREQYQRQVMGLLYNLADYYAQLGDDELALFYANRQLELEPWCEEGHQQIMRTLAASGQRSQALAQYRRCRRVLAAQLAVEPSPETQQLYQAIKQGGALLEALRTRQPAQHLPSPGAPLVGRDVELQQLVDRVLDPDSRLLCVLGLDGTGKTSLALHAAHQAAISFRDGARLLNLAAAPTAAEVCAQLARTVGLRFDGRGSLSVQLLDFLREKELLLLVDGADQAPPDFPLWSQIADQAAGVTLLLIACRSLDLSDVWTLPLQGLAFPEDAGTADVAEYAAVKLFLDSVRRHHPGKATDAADLSAVAAICRAVDGNPLAIKLAAAWTRVLSPRQIAQKLTTSLDLLMPASAAEIALGSGLRTIVASSWAALAPAEQDLLTRLAVFPHSADAETIQAVTQAPPHLLASLVDHSALRLTDKGRYAMPGLLRHFALEEMSKQHEYEFACRHTHAQYFADFCARREHALQTGGQTAACAQMESEWVNLRTGWRFAVEHEQLSLLEAYLVPMQLYCDLCNQINEGEVLFAHGCATLHAKLQSQPDDQARYVYGGLLVGHGLFLLRQRDYGRARSTLDDATDWLSARPMSRAMTLALYGLGTVYFEEGNSELAHQYLESSALICQQVGDRWTLARVYQSLGLAAIQMRAYVEASNWLQMGLSIAQTQSDLHGIALCENSLATLARLLGHGQDAIKISLGLVPI